MKKLSALILSLALSAALLAGCGASASTAASSEAVSSEVVSEAVSEEAVSTAEAADSAEAIQFTFTVTGADGESTALADAGVISAEEAEAGFVTVVNGEAADYNKDGSWWCLTDAAGEMTSVGVADIELHDGDSYAFTYTK